MIVKVQQALNDNKVLVYNEDRSIFWEGKMSKEVKEKMNGRTKGYFNAEMIDTKVSINEEVEEQGW